MSEKPKQTILDHVQKPVFTFAEAAALLSLHPLTLRRSAARGELEIVRFGRAVRIPRDALEFFIEERRSAKETRDGS